MSDSYFLELTEGDYSKVYKDIELYCRKNTNAIIVGEFGDTSFPSISDIDIFICLKDDNFKVDKAKIIDFISKDRIRNYLCFHEPLIIPESLLPYLQTHHTLYNLRTTFNAFGDLKAGKNSDSQSFINLIWTTFLMSIVPEKLISDSFSVRDKLLILKNICQSISNITLSNNALSYSDEIRRKIFNRELSEDGLSRAFSQKIHELYSETNRMTLDASGFSEKNHKYRIGRRKCILKGKQNSFKIQNGNITIELKPDFFNFFELFYKRHSSIMNIQEYIKDSLVIGRFCKKHNTNYPFIVPFGYQFYRNDFKFYLKNKLYKLYYGLH